MTAPKFDIAAAFRNKETAMRASFMAIRDVTDPQLAREQQRAAVRRDVEHERDGHES